MQYGYHVKSFNWLSNFSVSIRMSELGRNIDVCFWYDLRPHSQLHTFCDAFVKAKPVDVKSEFKYYAANQSLVVLPSTICTTALKVSSPVWHFRQTTFCDLLTAWSKVWSTQSVDIPSCSVSLQLASSIQRAPRKYSWCECHTVTDISLYATSCCCKRDSFVYK